VVEDLVDLELDLVAAAGGVGDAGEQPQVLAQLGAETVRLQQVGVAVGDSEREPAAVLRQHLDDRRQRREHAEGKLEQVCGIGGRHQTLR
jgi:hypothetical protein